MCWAYLKAWFFRLYLRENIPERRRRILTQMYFLRERDFTPQFDLQSARFSVLANGGVGTGR